ncbi:hypothetical protein [Candidatus Phytoplasma asteris]
MEDRKTIKEEIRQQNPNYTRAQQRFHKNRQTKIPEMIIIPNK